MSGISRELWQRALAEVEPACDQSALTIQELRDIFGMGKSGTQSRMRALIKAGLASQTRKRIVKSCGTTQVVTAYRLLETKGRKRR